MREHEQTAPGASAAAMWRSIARRAALITLVATAVLALFAACASGVASVGSVLFAAVLVSLCCSSTLLVGAWASAREPSALFSWYMGGYVIKYGGFAAALWWGPSPGWLERSWFFVTAVLVLLLWQGCELVGVHRFWRSEGRAVVGKGRG